MQSNRLVILDRDGVINEDSPHAIRSFEAWHPLRGSIESIARLSQAGWRVAIATNQSGIGRGYLSEATLERIHAALHASVHALGGSIATIAVCPHAPQDDCACRKPRTGLMTRIEEVTGICAEGAPFVGDSLRDMQAAVAHGCTPVLVRTGNGHRDEPAARALGVNRVFEDLAAATDWLLRR